jgi:hypothetical protein
MLLQDSPTISGRTAVDASLRRLRTAGIDAPAREQLAANGGAGHALVASLAALLDAPGAMAAFADRLRQALHNNGAASITLTEPGDTSGASQVLETFCTQLREAGVPPSLRLTLCLAHGGMPLRAFVLVTRYLLGNGPRYVLLDADQDRSEQTWSYLWRLRRSRWAVLPCYGSVASTPCPLLTAEQASALLPAHAARVPPSSAWLPLRLHLPRLADADGWIRTETLEHSLAVAMDAAETLLGEACWAHTDLQCDALANRRIALLVTGFGDLVVMRHGDPSDLTVLRSLTRLARRIYATVWRRSAELARNGELLPALAQTDPQVVASDGRRCERWSGQWRAAMQRCAVRHRNLMLMSPYSVLPADRDGCAEFANLLPVIATADAWSFAAAPGFRGWNSRQFKHFHLRARAEICRRHDASIIATKV